MSIVVRAITHRRHERMTSAFIDANTVTTYHHLGATVRQQHRHLPQLTATEHHAYSRLLAEELRIEQERINSHTVIATLLDK